MTEPRIELGTHHWHLVPFRDDWPGGWGVALVKLFDAAVKDSRLADQEFSDTVPVEVAITSAIAKVRPLCCFVGDDVMRVIYKEVGKLPPDLTPMPRPERRALKRLRGKPVA
jgi:hypothetical protein